MRRMTMILGIVVLLVLAAMAYVRLAPSDPAVWDVPLTATADADMAGGVIRVRNGEDLLARLDPIIRATPRTQVLAGSVEAGRVTYVTRSLVWGFPDYTTVEQSGDTLRIYGRLRFGQSDLGVNKARVDGWLDRL